MYDRDALTRMLKAHEGYKNVLYPDSEGIITLGIGHALGHRQYTPGNLFEAGVADKPFPDPVLQVLFQYDTAEAEKELRALASMRNVNFDALSPNRQMALIDMAFNLGTSRLGAFMRMWGGLAAGDYETAAREALDSKWAKQVGPRALELAELLRIG